MVEDRIEIPIEVKISDSKEIDEKIRELKEARQEATLPLKGKSKTSGSQAVPTLDTASTGGLAEAGIQTLPKRGKVNPLNLKKATGGQVVLKRDLEKFTKDKVGVLETIFNLGTGKQSAVGAITGFAAKAAPPIAAALIAIGFIEKIIAVMFGPGGPFDTRFNEFEARVNKLFSTREEQQKRQGDKNVRITAYYGSRGGKDTTFSTLEPLSRNTYVFDRDLHLISKRLI